MFRWLLYFYGIRQSIFKPKRMDRFHRRHHLLTNLKGLYDNLGIKGIYITSGRNKAMGAADLELTDEQRDILQSLVDEAYEQFVEIVAEGRKMTVEEVKRIADGRILSAKQALELNLIDEIATYDEVKKLSAQSLKC